jgi:hypothetical protein
MLRGLYAFSLGLGAVALFLACVGDDPNPGNTTIIVNGEGGATSSSSGSSSGGTSSGGTSSSGATPEEDAGPGFCANLGKPIPVLCDDFDRTSSNPPTGWALEVGNASGGISNIDNKFPKSLPSTFYATNGPSDGGAGYRQEITRTFDLQGVNKVTLDYEIALDPSSTPSALGVTLFWPETGAQITLSAETMSVAVGYAYGPSTFTTLNRHPINWAERKPSHVTIVLSAPVQNEVRLNFTVNSVPLETAVLLPSQFKITDKIQVNAGILDNRTRSVASLWLDNIVLRIN